MNRTQKKCFVASAGFHLLLLAILFVGPAFFSASTKVDDTQVIDFIPANLIDKPFTGGGPRNPNPPPAAVQRQVAPPAPQPTPVRPVPQKETVKETRLVKRTAEPVRPARETKRHLPDVSTKIVTRTTEADRWARQRERTEARERAEAVQQTVRSLQEGLSSSTTIEMPAGFGGGGEAYASYAQVVKSVYTHAWIPPNETSSDEATVKARVTIASDGTVLSAVIIQPSGDTNVDASVRRTLERVTFVAPFPKGAKEQQRPYIINFNLKAKRLTE